MRPTHNISHQATSSNWPPKITAILHILVNMHSKLQTVYWDVHTTKCRTQKKQVEFLADLIILSIGAFTFVYGLLSSNISLRGRPKSEKRKYPTRKAISVNNKSTLRVHRKASTAFTKGVSLYPKSPQLIHLASGMFCFCRTVEVYNIS